MKTKPLPRNLFGFALALAGLAPGMAQAVRAAPLTATAAVQTQPDPAAPIITYLKAGTEPTPSADPTALPPPGWIAVDLPGPFQAYVLNRDFTKGLDVKAGSTIYLEPKDGAAVLTTSAAGDKTEITGLFGRWTQISLERKLVGYVNLAPQAAAAAAPSPSPAAPAAVAAPTGGPGAPATSTDQGGAPLPGIYEGTFVSSHRWIGPKRPYPWQLDDASGTRVAYLDLSKLMFTDQVDAYVGKSVAVFGAVRPVPDGKDIVIAVESLELK